MELAHSQMRPVIVTLIQAVPATDDGVMYKDAP